MMSNHLKTALGYTITLSSAHTIFGVMRSGKDICFVDLGKDTLGQAMGNEHLDTLTRHGQFGVNIQESRSTEKADSASNEDDGEVLGNEYPSTIISMNSLAFTWGK
jgi:hypothetical protein